MLAEVVEVILVAGAACFELAATFEGF